MATTVELPAGFVLDAPAAGAGALPEGFVVDQPVTPAVQPTAPVAAPVPTGQDVAPQAQPAEQGAGVGFLGRVREQIAAREAEGEEIVEMFRRGEQGFPETLFQVAGKTIAGGALDVAGEVVSTALGMAGQNISEITPDFIEGPIAEGSTDALEWTLESEAGQLGLEAARAGEQAYEEFAAENPRAARNIESVFNVGLIVAPGVSGAKAAGKVPSFSKKALATIPESEDLFRAATKKFTKVKQSGSTLSSDKFVDFMGEFENAFNKQIDPSLHPRLTGTLNLLQKRVGDDLDAEDLLLLRRNIGSVGRSLEPDERRLGNALLREFDNFVEDLPGDKDWREARKLYSQGIKTEMVEEAIDKAGKTASGIENGLRIEFRKILNNKNKSKRFSKEERAAMSRVVEGDFTTNTLKKIGGFSFGAGAQRSPLTALAGAGAGAGVGGPVGAILVPAAGRVSQGLAQARTNRAANVVRALTSGVEPDIIPTPIRDAATRAAQAVVVSDIEGAQTEEDIRLQQ